MLRTPAGRIQVKKGIAYRLWPVLSRLARLYRATAARNVRLTVVIGSFGKSPQEAAEALRRVLKPGDVKGHRSQRLDRVRLILQGRNVRCDPHFCDLRTIDCEDCPMLETGWAGRRVILEQQ